MKNKIIIHASRSLVIIRKLSKHDHISIYSICYFNFNVAIDKIKIHTEHYLTSINML